MITEENYPRKIKLVRGLLPRGSRAAIASNTGESYATVNNVLSGIQFKENIIAEINTILKRQIKRWAQQK